MRFGRRFLLGAAVTAAFLTLLMVRMDLSDVGSSFAEGNYAYVVPAIAVYFVALYFRAYRWGFLLRPLRSLSTRRLFPVVAVGYMANNLLPVRLGELGRSYYLARREPVSASTALATIIVERVFDGLVLLFLLVVAALFLPVAGLSDRVSDAVRLPVPLVAVVVALPFMAALTAMIGIALYPATAGRVVVALTRPLPAGLQAESEWTAGGLLRGLPGPAEPSAPRRYLPAVTPHMAAGGGHVLPHSPGLRPGLALRDRRAHGCRPCCW